jgi:hydrogenase-4 component B
MPRSEDAARAHESGPSILGPMFVLAGCCCFIGLAPGLIAPLLAQGVSAWAPELGNVGPKLATLAPLGWITGMGLALLAALALMSSLLWFRLRSRAMDTGPTWGCGYAATTPRMQYTSSSFAQMLVGLFAWALRPRTRRRGPLELFPQTSSFHSAVPDTVLDEAVLPAFRGGAWALSWLRVVQQGSTQVYLVYVFLALIALLLWR